MLHPKDGEEIALLFNSIYVSKGMLDSLARQRPTIAPDEYRNQWNYWVKNIQDSTAKLRTTYNINPIGVALFIPLQGGL